MYLQSWTCRCLWRWKGAYYDLKYTCYQCNDRAHAPVTWTLKLGRAVIYCGQLWAIRWGVIQPLSSSSISTVVVGVKNVTNSKNHRRGRTRSVASQYATGAIGIRILRIYFGIYCKYLSAYGFVRSALTWILDHNHNKSQCWKEGYDKRTICNRLDIKELAARWARLITANKNTAPKVH